MKCVCDGRLSQAVSGGVGCYLPHWREDGGSHGTGGKEGR